MTKQRRRILEALRATTLHPTASELYDRVRRDMPRVSLGTVYRNLKLLVGEGDALQLDTGAGRSHFDGTTRPHHHVTCVACSSVRDVEVGRMLILAPRVKGQRAYRFLGHRLEFFGVCPECRSARRRRPARASQHRNTSARRGAGG
jgi:Fur family ferric uptake transcriptional regulator